MISDLIRLIIWFSVSCIIYRFFVYFCKKKPATIGKKNLKVFLNSKILSRYFYVYKDHGTVVLQTSVSVPATAHRIPTLLSNSMAASQFYPPLNQGSAHPQQCRYVTLSSYEIESCCVPQESVLHTSNNLEFE